VLTAALARRDRLPRHHPVDPDTARRIARFLADAADHRTGRNARPTIDSLAELAGCSERTVQRALKLLEALGVVVRVSEGRSILSRSERLQAWRNGSSHRRIAAEFALIVPLALARVVHRAGPRPVERVTPPGYSEGELVKSPDLRFFGQPKDRRRSRASPGAHSKRRPPGVTPAGLRASRLATGVQQRIGWLSAVSPRRLTALHRFAAQGWTPRDVHRALDEVLRARGWSVPDKIEQPAAYLAALLRGVDPGDRPGALEEAMQAEERQRREWLWATRFGTAECAHGQAAGDLPHPIDGHVVCPFCRHEREDRTDGAS
jgi:AraC-like DNA-binding protein